MKIHGIETVREVENDRVGWERMVRCLKGLAEV